MHGDLFPEANVLCCAASLRKQYPGFKIGDQCKEISGPCILRSGRLAINLAASARQSPDRVNINAPTDRKLHLKDKPMSVQLKPRYTFEEYLELEWMSDERCYFNGGVFCMSGVSQITPV